MPQSTLFACGGRCTGPLVLCWVRATQDFLIAFWDNGSQAPQITKYRLFLILSPRLVIGAASAGLCNVFMYIHKDSECMDRYLQRLRLRLLMPPLGGVTYEPCAFYGWFRPDVRYSVDQVGIELDGTAEGKTWATPQERKADPA